MARFGRAQPVPRHVIRPAAALAVRPADTGTGADADTYADAYADAYSGPVTGTGADALTPAAVALTLTEAVTCADAIAFLVAALEQTTPGPGTTSSASSSPTPKPAPGRTRSPRASPRSP